MKQTMSDIIIEKRIMYNDSVYQIETLSKNINK